MRNIDLQHPAFYSLSLTDKEQLLRNSAILHFNKNEIIIKQGSFITHIYYLLSGMAKVDYAIRNQNNTIRVVPEQRFIGLMYSFPGKHFEIRATAITSSEVLLIDIETFKTVLRTNGNFALGILDTVSLTGSRIVGRLLTYHNKNIEGSLAAFLLQLYELYNKNTFVLPLSRKEVAETIGYTRESVVHSFSRFIKHGLISQEGKIITLHNIEMLNEIMNKS
ncbi:MAG: Crp/Fnr family transcriptional regulator [Salinivirgaceae bacterium]|nr:Crp/Fnr family transcriptional regulator [Salinivirgaceae bacterium]MDD4747010.1 Crp/Fnr family transcriptional regulator [Salinivirgaceae bacterium]MDY0280733.1 Crp/Fnr family transcriptional regulator [Salinivirgaceae bacterium]